MNSSFRGTRWFLIPLLPEATSFSLCSDSVGCRVSTHSFVCLSPTSPVQSHLLNKSFPGLPVSNCRATGVFCPPVQLHCGSMGPYLLPKTVLSNILLYTLHGHLSSPEHKRHEGRHWCLLHLLLHSQGSEQCLACGRCPINTGSMNQSMNLCLKANHSWFAF